MEKRQLGAASAAAGTGAEASASGSTYTFKRPLPRLSESSMASNTRALSAPCMRNRSATTSSTLRTVAGAAASGFLLLAVLVLAVKLESDPNLAVTSRSA